MVTAFRVIFLVAFGGGLILAVFSMLHGVESTRRKRNRTRKPSPFFNLPAAAAFAAGFGATGYLIATRTVLPPWATLVLALAGGGLVLAGMITLLARWALRGLTGPSSLDDEDIQGQPAVVTREISLAGAGEISYEHRGAQVRVAARGLDTRTLPAGTEVVIDRIEDGTAFVEEWAVVEQRL
jgi:membrane protein implicated in regulation of membrane protease activity